MALKSVKNGWQQRQLIFNFLGFNVFLVDLLGHGDSLAKKGFGVNDSEYLLDFIDTEIGSDEPLYIVGNSMGSISAITISKKRQITGVILQAPMIQFDDAVPAYALDSPQWYSVFLSDSTLRKAAIEALAERGIKPDQTNTSLLLNETNTAVLIFASNTDNVSPHQHFAMFDYNNVEVIEVKNRHHAYMSIIGQDEHVVILEWLNNLGD
jgi:hypothetical protein